MKRALSSPLQRKVIGLVLAIPAALLACLLVLLGLLLACSPGKLEPFVTDQGEPLAGSISEKVFVNIGGVEQGMFIRGKDATQPVLLYVHGGMPDYFLTQKFKTDLEDYFTVVWWEQRGSGISYRPDMPSETITGEQLISDTLEVTNYLRHRFGQDKIYLMGHSGGTFIAIQAAAQAPQLYAAYIGMAQISHQLASERLAYEYMLEQFRQSGNQAMARKLEQAPVTLAAGTPEGYLALRDKAMHGLGIGTTHDMRSVITGIFIPSLTFRGYTLLEKLNLWRGKAQSGVSALWGEIMATDLTQQVPELEIPVYLLSGIYDYTCSYALAKDYFARLDAPVKGFYTFEHSAHSPLFEEPHRALRILREDVLQGVTSLADAIITQQK